MIDVSKASAEELQADLDAQLFAAAPDLVALRPAGGNALSRLMLTDLPDVWLGRVQFTLPASAGYYRRTNRGTPYISYGPHGGLKTFKYRKGKGWDIEAMVSFLRVFATGERQRLDLKDQSRQAAESVKAFSTMLKLDGTGLSLKPMPGPLTDTVALTFQANLSRERVSDLLYLLREGGFLVR